MELIDSLKLFCTTFPRQDKYGDVDFGRIEIKSEILAAKDTALKGLISQYFSLLSISDDAQIGGAFMMDIYSLERSLNEGKEGWEDYLEDTWIPLGSRHDNIIFVKSEMDICPVYGIFTGSDDVILLADSLSSFFEVISMNMVMEEKEFNYEIDYEKNGYLRLKDNFIQRVSDIIGKILSQESQKGFMEFFFG